MIKLCKWFFMLSKRLYKKATFVVLLLLIPICVLAFSFVASRSGGFVKVVLAQEDNKDKIASEIITSLSQEDSLVSFSVADSKDLALNEVENGLADEAWVFVGDTQAAINEFGKSPKPVVAIFTKEQSVTVRMAREKLTSALYKYCARAYYLDYMRANFSKLNGFSDQELLVYFQNTSVDDNLFEFNNPNSATLAPTNYLTSPIRGLLAVFTVLCGLAAIMYYKQDEANGTFAYVKNSRKGLVAFVCTLTAIINIMLVLFVSLLLSSLCTSILRELIVLVLYAVCCTSFCLLLGTIFKNIRTYSAIIPLLTVIFIGVCPIFFDFRSLYTLQLLLPPTYYVNAVFDNKFLLYMLAYSAICLILSGIIKFCKTKIACWFYK